MKGQPLMARSGPLFAATIESWRSLLGEPAISWAEGIQAIALARARVVFGKRRTYAMLPDRSIQFRLELQMLWKARRLRRLPGPLAVAVEFRGRGLRGDVDNMAKAILDAGNEILWHDDREVAMLAAAITAWGPGQEPLIGLDIWRIPA